MKDPNGITVEITVPDHCEADIASVIPKGMVLPRTAWELRSLPQHSTRV
jgi:hypothetical protein